MKASYPPAALPRERRLGRSCVCTPHARSTHADDELCTRVDSAAEMASASLRSPFWSKYASRRAAWTMWPTAEHPSISMPSWWPPVSWKSLVVRNLACVFLPCCRTVSSSGERTCDMRPLEARARARKDARGSHWEHGRSTAASLARCGESYGTRRTRYVQGVRGAPASRLWPHCALAEYAERSEGGADHLTPSARSTIRPTSSSMAPWT